MRWKYLQFDTKQDAIDARKEHFQKCPGNACRLMPNGKLAYYGTFGGTLPNKRKGWSDAARQASAEARRNKSSVRDSIVDAVREVNPL